MEADWVAFGLAPEALPDEAEEETDYRVLPENWEAVQVFIRCATQWRYAGMAGQPTGLDYPALESVMRMRGVDDLADTFDRIRIMEGEVLRVLREKE